VQVNVFAWLLVAGAGALGFLLSPKLSARARDALPVLVIGVIGAIAGTLIRSTGSPYSILELLLLPELLWSSEGYFGFRLQVTSYLFVAGALGLMLATRLRKHPGHDRAL
jgi:hypothetical protein